MSEFSLEPEDAGEVITLAGCALALAYAAGFDGRVNPESEAQAQAWHDALGGGPDGYAMRAGDVRAAILEHYQHSTERVMVAHVVEIVTEWREQWHAGHEFGVPMPVGGRTPRDQLAAPGEGRRALPPGDQVTRDPRARSYGYAGDGRALPGRPDLWNDSPGGRP